MDATNVGASPGTEGTSADEATNTTWRVYEMPPMDLDWPFMRDVLDVARMFASGNTDINGDAGLLLDQLVKAEARVRCLCGSWSLDGLRNGPSMFFIPGPYESTGGFVWKRDRQGATYVASPVELPHLAEWEMPRKR